jgi:phosphoribosylanthranilate isomerase
VIEMILDKITITGADNKVNLDHLYELSKQYPKVEWGILVYDKKMGSPRYPTKDWVNYFQEGNGERFSTSAHLCGDSANQFLNKDQNIYAQVSKFKRVQLNIRFDNTLTMSEKITKSIFELMKYQLNKFHDKQQCTPVIIQDNPSNHGLVNSISYDPYNLIQVLFDTSGGNGVSPSVWPKPSTLYCGYAGGIGPDNLKEVLQQISQVVPEDRHIWIDMESGVRTDNEFDIEKVKQVLEMTK